MSDEKQKLIDEAVEKALAGDEEAINNIEDRVTRAKAKAALVKAKRQGAVPDKGSPNDEKEHGDDKPKVEDKIEIIQSVTPKPETKIETKPDINKEVAKITEHKALPEPNKEKPVTIDDDFDDDADDLDKIKGNIMKVLSKLDQAEVE